MFRNILVPLDGSDTAEVVLPIAESLAKDLGAKVTIVRVVDVSAITRSIAPAAVDSTGFSPDMQKLIDQTVTAEKDDAGEYLAKVEAGLKAAGVDAATEVREGGAGEELLRAIHEDHIDMAAVATHGRSGLTRTIFGSVADRLIRESGKPILVVRAT